MSEITSSGGNTTPYLILADSVKMSQDARTVVHQLYSGATGYTFLGPGPRTGTLRLFYLTEAAAIAAHELHQLQVVFTIHEDDRPMLDGFRYIRVGPMELAMDPETQNRFILTINISEVNLEGIILP